MRLEFIYVPVSDLDAALALYRDELGFDELWREGESTVGLAIEGTTTALMVDAAPAPGSASGPVFSVESVDDWLAGRELDLVLEPFDIPGGRIASFRDATGNQVYVMDQSTA